MPATAVVKECNGLGLLIDLAQANKQTTEMAPRFSPRSVVVSYTGLDTQSAIDTRVAQMMRLRLISKEQAKMVADAGVLLAFGHISPILRRNTRRTSVTG